MLYTEAKVDVTQEIEQKVAVLMVFWDCLGRIGLFYS